MEILQSKIPEKFNAQQLLRAPHVHVYNDWKIKNLSEDRNKWFNLHCFIDKEKLIKKNADVVEHLKSYQYKYRFTLSFVFSVLRMKESILLNSDSSLTPAFSDADLNSFHVEFF
jgi:hypothetical protein